MSETGDDYHRVGLDQIQTGVALPFDTFDASGHLLLRRGHVIQSQDQLERLLERGLYRDPQEVAESLKREAASQRGYVPPKGHKQSALAQLADIQTALGQWLGAQDMPQAPQALLTLARMLQQTCQLDPDASLASIQVLTEGRYSVRRMVHSAVLTELLLAQWGMPEEERTSVVASALTMNLCVLELQDTLSAQSTAPTDEQRAHLRRHPQDAVQELRARGVDDALWLACVLQHHERLDGSGYPQGLRGEAITLPAQVIALADRYGAMATGRSYRPSALPNLVLKNIFSDKDKTVDARLVSLLVKTVGVYPPGSVVVLANGDTAVVVKRTQQANCPVVKVVRTQRAQILEEPRKRLTSEAPFGIDRIIPMTQLGFSLDPHRLWDEGVVLTA